MMKDMSNLIIKAAQFAAKAHKGQFRKHSKRPYITHPGRVASAVTIHKIASPVTVAATWTHDVDEDTKYSLQDISEILSPDVSLLVGELTNPSKGIKASRAERKVMDRKHLTDVSQEAKIIKLFDRQDNLQEIIWDINLFDQNTLDWAKMYARESILLVDCLESADEELAGIVYNTINKLSAVIDERKDYWYSLTKEN